MSECALRPGIGSIPKQLVMHHASWRVWLHLLDGLSLLADISERIHNGLTDCKWANVAAQQGKQSYARAVQVRRAPLVATLRRLLALLGCSAKDSSVLSADCKDAGLLGISKSCSCPSWSRNCPAALLSDCLKAGIPLPIASLQLTGCCRCCCCCEEP